MMDLNELIGKIHPGDCMEYLPHLPDKCIDLVLTDPPYGGGFDTMKHISVNNKAQCGNYKYSEWNNSIPEKNVFDEIFRVSKNQIIWGGNYFTEYLKNSPCWLVWDKVNTGNFADCELAWTSFKKSTRMFSFMWNGMLQGDMKNKTERIHPTQKPHQLFQWVLENYSEQDQLILDPFSGSGTAAIACHNLKRKFICIEKDPEYVEKSIKRLEQEKIQMVLF